MRAFSIRAWRLAFALFLSLAFASAQAAPGQPRGPSFIVDGGVADILGEAHVLRASTTGNYLVYWFRSVLPFGPYGTYGRLYDANGVALGQPFLISPEPLLRAAMRTDGGFAMVWPQYQGNVQSLMAQSYSASGVASGSPAKLATLKGYHRGYRVAMNASGEVVLAWNDHVPVLSVPALLSAEKYYDFSYNRLYAQRFTADLKTLGSPQLIDSYIVEFELLNSVTQDFTEEPGLSLDDAGNFVVSWMSRLSKDHYLPSARRYDRANKAGPLLRPDDTGQLIQPLLYADGGFLLSWHRQHHVTAQSSNGYDAYAQRYSAASTPLGSSFQINSSVIGFQTVSVSSDASGYSFVWPGLTGADCCASMRLQLRRFSKAGLSLDQQIVSDPDLDHTYAPNAPELSPSQLGSFMVVWERGAPNEKPAIAARLYSAY